MIRAGKRLILKGLSGFGYELVHKQKNAAAPVESANVAPASASMEPARLDARWNRSPIDQFLDTAHATFSTGHFDQHYVVWRMRRLRKAIQLQGIDFKGKRVLELGGGHGDMGAFFAELGADVISAEGREINCHFANLKYRHLPSFRSVQHDLEKPFGDLGRFDLAFSFGSLEVIWNAADYIKSCCEVADTVLFETFVIDSTDPLEAHGGPGVNGPNPDATEDHSLSGGAIAPSPAYIERLFSEHGFRVERFFDADINAFPHCYDWEHGDLRTDIARRRFWRFTRG